MKKSEDKTGSQEEPKVIAAARVSGRWSISRRDFLKFTTSTLATAAAVPLLSSCAPPPPPPSTATPGIPSGSIRNNDTALLGFPGDVADVIVILLAGTAVEFITRDATRTWLKVRVREGENRGKEGWVQVQDVSFDSSYTAESIPVSNEFSARPTIEITVEGKVIFAQSIYTTPGDSQTSGTVQQGETVEIVERDSTDTWFKVRTSGGQTGWVEQYSVEASPEYSTKIKINYAVVPIPASSSGSGSSDGSSGSDYITLTYWYPN